MKEVKFFQTTEWAPGQWIGRGETLWLPDDYPVVGSLMAVVDTKSDDDVVEEVIEVPVTVPVIEPPSDVPPEAPQE